MNQETGIFHELLTPKDEEIATEKGWVRFERGELVAIKGQQFRVMDIGQDHVVLRSERSIALFEKTKKDVLAAMVGELRKG